MHLRKRLPWEVIGRRPAPSLGRGRRRRVGSHVAPGEAETIADESLQSFPLHGGDRQHRGVEPAAELMLYVVHGVLHLLGMDHERMTYHFSGRDMRLTDVHGEVIHDLFA